MGLFEGAQAGEEGASQKEVKLAEAFLRRKLLVAVVMRSVSGDAVHLKHQAFSQMAMCGRTMNSVARNCANAGGVPA